VSNTLTSGSTSGSTPGSTSGSTSGSTPGNTSGSTYRGAFTITINHYTVESYIICLVFFVGIKQSWFS